MNTTSTPMSIKFLAIVDFLVASAIAIMSIDYPWISLAMLVGFWPVTFGLWQGRRWGWWMGIVMHGLLMLAGAVIYTGLMFELAVHWDRPRGHMEIISNQAAMVILTVVFIVYELVALVPVYILSRRATREAFSARLDAVQNPSWPYSHRFTIARILFVGLLVVSLPSLLYLCVIWLVGGWHVR